MDDGSRTDMMDSGKPGRRIYIDFLKILAIFMVVFNHTGTNGFLLFTVNRGSRLYPLYLFSAVFIKMAVPLFFMCSGALLLGKRESYKELLRKRFLRFLVVLAVSSALVYLYRYFRTGAEKELSVSRFLETVYQDAIITPYWYLYRYLAYILMLPILRMIAGRMTGKEFRWMLLLYGIMNLLPIIEFLVWKGEVTHSTQFFLVTEINYVFYPLTGYYIDRVKLPEKNGKTILVLSALSIAAIAVCCLMTHYRSTLLNCWKSSNCQTFLATLVFVPAITVFFSCRVWFSRHKLKPGTEKRIAAFSGLVFGIYLLESICRSETKGIYAFLKPYIHSLPACLIWVFCVCLLGGIVAFILKKIPWLKKAL